MNSSIQNYYRNFIQSNLIRQEKVYQIPSVIQTSKEIGMQTMEMAIKEQMMYGVIGMEDAKPYLE